MNIIFALLLWTLGVQGTTDPTILPQEELEKVYKIYPYVTYRGKLFTYETELKWPDGYTRLDPKQLSPYQEWVSHMPLWHFQVGAYSPVSGNVYPPDKLSRAIHLPWRTSQFKDNVVPLQVQAEYLLSINKENQWNVLPIAGDTITYDKFLANDVVYDSRHRLKFISGEVRFPDSLEFSKFITLISINTNYLSLESNADAIREDQIRPGDLFIGRNESGTEGRVYVITVVVQNSKGDKRYIVGTGCPEPCDFHIPLFHDDRSNPWLTIDELKALPPSTFPMHGFFRLRLPK